MPAAGIADTRGGDRRYPPVAPDLGLGRGHPPEGRDGRLGPELLIESDGGVEHDNRENREGIHVFAQCPRDDPGSNEKPDDEALELAEEDLPGTDPRSLHQLVGAVGRQTPGRFLRRKSLGGRPELRQHRDRGPEVPASLLRGVDSNAGRGHAFAPD